MRTHSGNRTATGAKAGQASGLRWWWLLLAGLVLALLLVPLALYAAWPWLLPALAPKLLTPLGVEQLELEVERPGWQQLLVPRASALVQGNRVQVQQLVLGYSWANLRKQRLDSLVVDQLHVILAPSDPDSPPAEELPAWPELPVDLVTVAELQLQLPEPALQVSGKLRFVPGQLQAWLQLDQADGLPELPVELPLLLQLSLQRDGAGSLVLATAANTRPLAQLDASTSGGQLRLDTGLALPAPLLADLLTRLDMAELIASLGQPSADGRLQLQMPWDSSTLPDWRSSSGQLDLLLADRNLPDQAPLVQLAASHSAGQLRLDTRLAVPPQVLAAVAAQANLTPLAAGLKLKAVSGQLQLQLPWDGSSLPDWRSSTGHLALLLARNGLPEQPVLLRLHGSRLQLLADLRLDLPVLQPVLALLPDLPSGVLLSAADLTATLDASVAWPPGPTVAAADVSADIRLKGQARGQMAEGLGLGLSTAPGPVLINWNGSRMQVSGPLLLALDHAQGKAQVQLRELLLAPGKTARARFTLSGSTSQAGWDWRISQQPSVPGAATAEASLTVDLAQQRLQLPALVLRLDPVAAIANPVASPSARVGAKAAAKAAPPPPPPSLVPGAVTVSLTKVVASATAASAQLSLNLAPQMGVLTVPVQLQAKASWKEPWLRLDGSVTGKHPNLVLPFSARYALPSSRGEFALNTKLAISTPLLAGAVRGWSQNQDLLSGNLAVDVRAQVDLSGAEPDWSLAGNLGLADVALRSGNLLALGLAGELAFNLDPDGMSLAADPLTLVAADVGVAVTDIRATVDLQDQVLRLTDVSGMLLGGKVSSTGLAYPLDTGATRFPLQLQGLDLAQILALEGDQIQGNGILDGTLQVLLTAEGVAVQEGKVRARPPGGTLRYPEASSIAAAAGSNLGLDFALRALDNFSYTSLDADVDYGLDGSLVLAVHLRGRNPDVEAGRPIHYNLTVTESIPALLRSLRLSGDVEERIKRRVQQQRKPAR